MISIYLAFSYVKGNIRNTIIATFGVALSISILIISIGIANGFANNTVKSMLSISPHVKATSSFGLIKNYDKDINKIESIDGVEIAYPKLSGKGIIKYQNKQMKATEGVGIDGIRPKDLISLGFKDKMLSGDIIKSDNSVMIGSELASSMNLKVGDNIKIISHENREIGMKVEGIFSTGFYQYDNNFVIIPLEISKKIFNIDFASEISIKVKDVYSANRISKLVSDKTFLQTKSWFDMNKQLLKGIILEKRVMVSLLSLLLVISGFVISVLISNGVKDKTRDIGIMRAMGFNKTSIALSFIILGFIFNIFGIAIASVLSYVIYTILQNFTFSFVNEVYYMPEQIPFAISYIELVYILLGSFVISFLASLIPSLQTSKLNIVKALKYE